MDSSTDISNGKLVYFSAVRKLEGIPFPFDFEKYVQQNGLKIEITTNERAMLNYFLCNKSPSLSFFLKITLLAKLQLLDPDMFVGHNFLGFDLDVLLHRMNHLNIGNWSILGRLKRRK